MVFTQPHHKEIHTVEQGHRKVFVPEGAKHSRGGNGKALTTLNLGEDQREEQVGDHPSRPACLDDHDTMETKFNVQAGIRLVQFVMGVFGLQSRSEETQRRGHPSPGPLLGTARVPF